MSFPVDAGSQKLRVYEWCLPPGYLVNHMGAQSVTVTVSVRLADPNDDNPAVDLSDLFATMAWGSSTADTQMSPDCQEVDFDANGAALTVQASSLTVYITYPGPPSVAHPRVVVDVSVGIGTSGKSGIFASAQKTVKVEDLIAGGISGDQPIPAFAVGATLINNDRNTPFMVLDQLRAINGILTSSGLIGKNPTVGIPIARGLGARAFHLVNQTASPLVGLAVLFDLSPN